MRILIDGIIANLPSQPPPPTPLKREVILPRQGVFVCLQNNSIKYGWILMKLQEMLTMAPMIQVWW